MPYIKDADFVRVTELTQLMKELGEKASHPSIPDIADRVLKIMADYRGRLASHSILHNPHRRKESGIKG